MENNLYVECPVKNALNIQALYTFSRRRFSVGYEFKGETHDFWEAVCVADGKAGITADKNVYVLSAGQLILHPPGEFHAIWSDRGTEPETVIFSFRADEFSPDFGGIYTLSPELVAELKNIRLAAEKAFAADGNNVSAVRAGMEREASAVVKRLELFLLTLLCAGDAGAEKNAYSSKSTENYMQILSAMENKIGDAPTAADLAALCNMSVSSLEKTVYRYSGCGAMSYFSNLKMQKATEMLASGASVKETALSLGFANQNYFSAAFKKRFGYPPSRRAK